MVDLSYDIVEFVKNYRWSQFVCIELFYRWGNKFKTNNGLIFAIWINYKNILRISSDKIIIYLATINFRNIIQFNVRIKNNNVILFGLCNIKNLLNLI